MTLRWERERRAGNGVVIGGHTDLLLEMNQFWNEMEEDDEEEGEQQAIF